VDAGRVKKRVKKATSGLRAEIGHAVDLIGSQIRTRTIRFFAVFSGNFSVTLSGSPHLLRGRFEFE
jgi:hypothetical protein